VIFTGQAEAKIDDKSRLAIPAKFRTKDTSGDAGSGTVWYCVPWLNSRSLRLYPEAMFARLSEAGRQGASLMPDGDQADLELTLYSATEQAEQDGNNRIRLASWQVEALGLSGEVMVLGARDYLEVRSREGWQPEFMAKLARLSSPDARRGSAKAGTAGGGGA
jgi:DNA-binding transcriptional regulator/RsmH inhibitor MraZ